MVIRLNHYEYFGKIRQRFSAPNVALCDAISKKNYMTTNITNHTNYVFILLNIHAMLIIVISILKKVIRRLY